MSIICTIGYQGSDVENIVATLRSNQVRQLVDLRAVPISRKKGFSKNGLAARLAEEGIAYLHFRDLGDPKAGRQAARAGDHSRFVSIYNHHLGQERSRASLRHTRCSIDRI